MADEFFVETNPDGLGWTRRKHPSYGVIGVSRVSGNQPLFDSDVIHGHFIEITIREAEKVRTGFTHEHVFGQNVVMQLRMSFAQFAQMITTQNVGDGTPCTLHYVKGDDKEPYATQWGGRPDPPDPEPFINKFKSVGKDRAQVILDNIDKATEGLKKLLEGIDKPTKANLATAAAAMASARQEVKSNLPYIMECLEEEMEVKLSNAVTEFESYVAGSLQEKGLEVMRGETMRLNIGVQKAIGPGEE
jgi:hypothetical protein